MISRDLANVQVVHAFNPPSTSISPTPFTKHTAGGFTCTCAGVLSTAAAEAGFGGQIIDRLGLRDNYNAVVPVVSVWGAVMSSVTTCVPNYLGVSVGLQHSSSTCSADFANYSTELWQINRALQRVSTATTTADVFYDAEAAKVSTNTAAQMSTAATTSTSTGYANYVSGPVPAFPLGSAKRFLRMVVAPHVETCGCGGSYMFVAGSLVFGDPDKGPASTGLRARVVVTSACTT